jgi:hypothetical protein
MVKSDITDELFSIVKLRNSYDHTPVQIKTSCY